MRRAGAARRGGGRCCCRIVTAPVRFVAVQHKSGSPRHVREGSCWGSAGAAISSVCRTDGKRRGSRRPVSRRLNVCWNELLLELKLSVMGQAKRVMRWRNQKAGTVGGGSRVVGGGTRSHREGEL